MAWKTWREVGPALAFGRVNPAGKMCQVGSGLLILGRYTQDNGTVSAQGQEDEDIASETEERS